MIPIIFHHRPISDLGGTLYGPWMRYCILTSIAVSQIGFVSAYTIFVAENLQGFILAASRCTTYIPVQYLILMQLIIFLPLALIRNLAKLSTTALVADVFILAGLIYIFGSEFGVIAERGIADVQLFNPKDFPLLIGYAPLPRADWCGIFLHFFSIELRYSPSKA